MHAHTYQFNFEQSDVYEDGELLHCGQSLQQSDDPGVHMISEGPGQPVNHSVGHKKNERQIR